MKARIFRRWLAFVVALVGAVYAFVWWIGQKGDFQLPSKTEGMIAAIKNDKSKSVACVVKEDGTLVLPKEETTNSADRDVTWDPKGNRVFFISDRKDSSFHIFRWDPERNTALDQKSIDKAGRSNLIFDAQDGGKAEKLSGLVTVRGTVQEFFPQTAESIQVMPPSGKAGAAITDEGLGAMGGAGSNMEMLYSRFGMSFRQAKWFGSRRFIAAIMRREDKGETLLVQDLMLDEKGQMRRPQMLMVGERFNIEVDPATGSLVYSVIGVIPVRNDDGKMVNPGFKNGLFVLNPNKSAEESLAPILLSNNDDGAISSFSIKPDGSSLLIAIGKSTEDGVVTVQGLLTCPLQPGGGTNMTPLIQGAITDPTYSPNGSKIAFIKREGSYRAIFIADADGSNVKNLTGDKGDFATPKFSPQSKS
jgi:hypothetical protein